MTEHKNNHPFSGKQAKKIPYLSFLDIENQHFHHRYDEEMLPYEYLKEGNVKAIENFPIELNIKHTGHLSDDPLRNMKYLFIASTTLATRFAIEGGLDSEIAYYTSDYYIQTIDCSNDLEFVKNLHHEMMLHFTRQVSNSHRNNVYSKPILLCQDYILNHLNEPLTLGDLARAVHLNPNYLSGLFQQELGCTFTSYLLNRRIEVAENMLLYSDFSCSRISSMLSFSSQSYFIKCFHKITGYTPGEYRNRFFHSTFEKQKLQRER